MAGLCGCRQHDRCCAYQHLLGTLNHAVLVATRLAWALCKAAHESVSLEHTASLSPFAPFACINCNTLSCAAPALQIELPATIEADPVAAAKAHAMESHREPGSAIARF